MNWRCFSLCLSVCLSLSLSLSPPLSLSLSLLLLQQLLLLMLYFVFLEWGGRGDYIMTKGLLHDIAPETITKSACYTNWKSLNKNIWCFSRTFYLFIILIFLNNFVVVGLNKNCCLWMSELSILTAVSECVNCQFWLLSLNAWTVNFVADSRLLDLL